MSRSKAIMEKCIECIYDPLETGSMRYQVERCEITSCALYPYRPVSKPRRKTKTEN
jgi:hypothetical protein